MPPSTSRLQQFPPFDLTSLAELDNNKVDADSSGIRPNARCQSERISYLVGVYERLVAYVQDGQFWRSRL